MITVLLTIQILISNKMEIRKILNPNLFKYLHSINESKVEVIKFKFLQILNNLILLVVLQIILVICNNNLILIHSANNNKSFKKKILQNYCKNQNKILIKINRKNNKN